MDLIDLTKGVGNDTFVQNSLILLMAISDDNPVDIYSSRGVDVAQLSTKNREEFNSIMKKEVQMH